MTDEWQNKIWYIYTMEYYSASKRNKSTETCYNMDEPWKNCLRKRSQTTKDKYCIIPLTCSTWNCEIQEQKQIEGGWEEVKDSLMGIEFYFGKKKSWRWIVVMIAQYKCT